MTDRLRESVATTILGLAFASITTIGTLSATFILNSNEQLDSDARKLDFESLEFSARANRGFTFLEQALKAQERETSRQAEFFKVFGKKSNIAELSKLSEVSLKNTNKDFATLSGYSPDSTGIGLKFHDNLQSYFRIELDFWRWVQRNQSMISIGPPYSARSLTELKEITLKQEFDVAALSSSFGDARFDGDARARALKKQSEELKEEIGRWRWRAKLAVFGFTTSMIIFWFAFTRFVLKAPALDLVARPADHVSRRFE